VVEEFFDGVVVVEFFYGLSDWFVCEVFKGVGDFVVFEFFEVCEVVFKVVG